MDLTIIVNICTIDNRFIPTCLNNCLQVTDNVIAVYSDHLFSGEPENFDLINTYEDLFPTVTFMEVPFNNKIPSRQMHNLFRDAGFEITTTEWVLFLDADEIFEVDKFKEWLKFPKYFDSYSFQCYWYFRETRFRATTTERCGLLVKKSLLTNGMISSAPCERWSLCVGTHQNSVNLDGQPFFHHYSWVRSKEEMIKKVNSWGHRDDKNWVSLVEEEFTHDFDTSCTDFVHGYSYIDLDENIF